MTSPRPHLVSKLEQQHPDVVMELGRFIIAWTPIDFFLMFILARVMGDDGSRTTAIMKNDLRLATRIRLIRRHIDSHEIDEGMRTRIKNALNDIKKLNDDRNQFVHGYLTHDEQDARFTHTRIFPEVTVVPVEFATIERATQTAFYLTEELTQIALWAGWSTHRQVRRPQVDGSRSGRRNPPGAGRRQKLAGAP